jgi:hypothetical protein
VKRKKMFREENLNSNAKQQQIKQSEEEKRAQEQ